MYSKFLYVFFIFVTMLSIDKCLADRDVITGTGTALVNHRITSIIPSENEYIPSITSCGGVLTEAPRKISLTFQKSQLAKNVHCTWKIHAPIDQRVYVREVNIYHMTPIEADTSVKETFTDSAIIDVYDGDIVSEEKRLFRYGVENTLDNAISTGQDLTIDFHYNESELHFQQQIILRYGFVKKSLL